MKKVIEVEIVIFQIVLILNSRIGENKLNKENLIKQP